jgi:Glycosyltransferase family 87
MSWVQILPKLLDLERRLIMFDWLLSKTKSAVADLPLSPNRLLPSIPRPLFLMSLFLVTVVTLWRIKFKILATTDPYIFRDFLYAYYPAGRLIIEAPSQLFEFTRGADGAMPVIYGFVNLPVIAYLFTPFAWLQPGIANFLYFCLGIVAVILSAWLLIRLAKLRGWQQSLFILLVGMNAPIFNSIWLGNSTHIIFPLLIVAFSYLRAHKYVWSGFWLALAGLIKIPLFLPVFYFLFKKRWLAVASFLITLTSIALVSILICGLPLNLAWFQKCILSFSGKAVAGDTLQSVDSFLIRLLTQVPIASFDPVDVDWRFKLLRYVLFTILIGATLVTVWRCRRLESAVTQNLEFSIFLVLALVVSPISWTHYYLLLLLPMALYLGDGLAIPKQWPWTLAMGFSMLLVMAPNVRTSPLDHPLVNALTRHFLVSHYFWGGLLMLGILVLALHRQAGCSRSLQVD